jgi:hypothetical protein
MRLGCCALALAACSGGGTKVDAGEVTVTESCTVTSGTRLRANYWTTSDGGKYFAGTWHDTMLGHDCAFGTDPADGKIYCLPTNDGIWATEYSDNQCTVPVVDVDPSCTATSPIFGFKNLTMSGSYALTFYPVGAAYTGARWQQNGCQPASDVAPTGYEFHTVGAPLDKSTFVAATAYSAMGATRLRATGYMAPDGAIQACSPTAFFDSQRNETCYLGTDPTDQPRCLPIGYSFSGANVFSDSACKNAAAQLSAMPAQSYEAVSVQVPCGTGTKLFKLAGPLATEYTTSTGVCALVSPTQPNYYTAGAEVTSDHFVALTDEPLAAAQRLQEIVHAAPDGFGMSTGTFSDSQLGGATCAFATASDGTTRCLPGDPTNAPKIGLLYSESTCRVPVSIISGPCGGVAPRFAQVVETPAMAATCSYQGATRVFAVGAMVTYDLYQASGSTCMLSPYGGDAYELGDELPPSTFVQGTQVAE